MNLKLLKQPLKNKWRVQSAFPKNNPSHVILVAYVDARDIQERLDDVCEPQNWCNRFYESKGKQFCEIGIKIGEEWVFKSDCGTPTKTEKEKGEASDAFKRAAVHWGINRVAYLYEPVKLPCRMYNGKAYPVGKDGRFLKGEKLYKECDRIAKVHEFEEAFEIINEPEINEDLKSNVLKR